MAGEPKLPEYPSAPVKMGHEFFRQIRDRIETVAPIESSETSVIRVKYKDGDGCEITIRAEPITITVCSNGAPFDIEILKSTAPGLTGKGSV